MENSTRRTDLTKRFLKTGLLKNESVYLIKTLEDVFCSDRRSRGVSPATIKSYKVVFNRVYDYCGFANGTDIRDKSSAVTLLADDEFIPQFRRYLAEERKCAEYTVFNTLRQLRVVMYFAMDAGLIKSGRITLKAVELPIKPTFTQQELEKLSKKPDKSDFVEYRTWVMLHYLSSTANRVSSMLALNVSDIDFENAAITVQVQKNRVPRQKPLLHPLAVILREYILIYRSDDLNNPLMNQPLFCNRFATRLAYRSAYDAFDDYFTKRNVKFTGFHKFRHTYGANWIREGGNPFMLKEQLDHRSLAMTYHYSNLYGMATREQAEVYGLANKLNPTDGRKAIKSARLIEKSNK